MKNINIGFDLGVASVGWSVYSVDDEKIIDKGVKLFYQANKAEDRRGARALRRRYKRQNHRLERFDLYLASEGYEFPKEIDAIMLETRIKGQSEKLSDQQLVNVLRFFLKYRGYNPTGTDDRDNLYKDKYPKLLACEVQKIILDENGHYRGLEYPFLIKDFHKEILSLLNVQKQYSKMVNDKFIENYLEIFNSRREFWEGPGGKRKDQLTPFGRYRNILDLEKALENDNHRKYLYQELIKDCSIYLGEKSVSKDNYYAQRFNFLNDMINLRFKFDHITASNNQYFQECGRDTYQLNIEGINLIEKQVLSGSTVNIKTILKKNFDINIDEVTGFRIDRSKKIEITKFDLYNKVRRKFEKQNFNMQLFEQLSEWNELCEIKAIVPTANQKEQMINRLSIKFTDVELDNLVDENFTGQYHSFSERALKVYITHMEKLLVNSSTLEKKYPELINNEVNQFLIDNYFPDEVTIKMSKHPIDDLIASPQVKKTLRKAIVTFNQIRKEYSKDKGYIINSVVIESNKEILSDEAKKEFEANQLDNEKTRQSARKEIEHLITSETNVETLIEKQVLLAETNYKCIYCDDIVNIDNMEIEHILPISKSADDSMANKVCSCRKCNHQKGNKTPYEFLSTSPDNWELYVKRVGKLKISNNKHYNLLFTDNINKYEKRFVSRNLRDTAYATKEFKKQFLNYQNALIEKRGMSKELMFDVITMPPQITGLVRRRYMEEKDRSQHYHHAFDATICAMYPTTGLGRLSNKIQNNSDSYWMSSVIEENIYELRSKFNFTTKQINELKSINYQNTRFHTEVKKSANGQLCNADINKIIIKQVGSVKKPKEEYRKIEYISNIYELEGSSLKKLADMLVKEKPANMLGIRNNDLPTYELIKKIYLEYKDLSWKNENGKDIKINPFVHFCCEEHEVTPDKVLSNISKYGIRPLSKRGKQRPVIKRLNYDKKVNQPFLLEKKTVNKKDTNLIMLDSLKTAYTVVYENLDKGGYLFLPVYAVTVNLKTGEPNTNHPYYQKLFTELIGDTKVKELFKVRPRDYLKVTKKDGTVTYSLYSNYHKPSKSLCLMDGSYASRSDIGIEKIEVYGLGIYGMNLDE